MTHPPFCADCPVPRRTLVVPPYCDCTKCDGVGTQRAVNDLLDVRGTVGGVECVAPILAIGMAPGGEEERRGRPLVGPSGRVFHTALHLAGYKGPVRKLNLLQCRTVRPGLTRDEVNRDPRKAEIDFCRKHFLDPEIAAFKARKGKLILLLGGLAFDHVTQGAFGSFTESRGHRLL